MEFKSKNPFLSNKSFTKGQTNVYTADGRPVEIIDYNNTMTVQGAINKTALLFTLLLAGAGLTLWMGLQGYNPWTLAITGFFAAFVLIIIGSVAPKTSPYVAPAYALFEGLFVGGLSSILELKYPGIALQAVAATFVTFGVCLALYRFGVVKVTEQFKSVVIASTLAIGTYYLISMLFYFIGGVSFFHHGNSLMSIGFSIFVIIIAALNLFMDFDMIEQGARQRNPKYMEWFGAMGLVITMVWLYIEFLRLLSKLQSRN